MGPPSMGVASAAREQIFKEVPGRIHLLILPQKSNF
jgi:hypothetical protein